VSTIRPLEIGRHKLFHGDALDVMCGLQDVFVDAVITDPPYCSGGFNEAARRRSKGLQVDERIVRPT
jgi:DNA modification methylase